MKTKNKGLRRNLKCFFLEISEDQKKKGLWRKFWSVFPWKSIFPALLYYNRPEFEGSINADWLFFVCSSSAQISMGRHLNVDGGTLNLDGGTLTLDGETRSPYDLSTEGNYVN